MSDSLYPRRVILVPPALASNSSVSLAEWNKTRHRGGDRRGPPETAGCRSSKKIGREQNLLGNVGCKMLNRKKREEDQVKKRARNSDLLYLGKAGDASHWAARPGW